MFERTLPRAVVAGGSRGRSPLRLIPLFLLLICGCGPSADQRQEEALIGSYNQDYSKVSKAQLILVYSGFSAGDLDGLMGPDTRDALRGFQKSRGLRSTSYIGDATWAELMKVERQEGPFTVERLQWGLKKAGFDPGAVDGLAGYMTKEAISRFQQAKELKATGRLNPETWAALKRLMPAQ